MKQTISILLVAIILCGCSKHKVRNGIYDSIVACCLQSHSDSCVINLNNFIDFKWDELYVFDSYAPHYYISERIGIPYGEEFGMTPDHNLRLLFLYGKDIVYEEDISFFHKKKKNWDFLRDETLEVPIITTPYLKVKVRISKDDKCYHLFPVSLEEFNEIKCKK